MHCRVQEEDADGNKHNGELHVCPLWAPSTLKDTQTRAHVQSPQGTQGEAGRPAGLRASGRHSECLTPVPTVTLKCHCPNDSPVTVTQLNTETLQSMLTASALGSFAVTKTGKARQRPYQTAREFPVRPLYREAVGDEG